MKSRPVKIIRKDLDGSEIRQTAGSTLYQVFLRGKFMSALPCAEMAHSLLSKLQNRNQTNA